MISLVVLMYRPGGIDLLAQSLAGTTGDWELVVVDDRPGRVERGEAQRYIKDLGLPLAWYGGSKNKLYPDTKGGLVNAANTALLHCRGDYVVFLSDYTLLPRHWLKQWESFIEQYKKGRNILLSGTAVELSFPKPNDPGDVVTWQGVTSWSMDTMIPLGCIKKPWVADFETFYYCLPISLAESLNGLDERADHCHMWPVSSLVSQARQLGYEMLVSDFLCCYMVDHRAWDDPNESAPWGAYDGLWRIIHGRSVEMEPEWVIPSPNNWDFKAERAKALAGGGQ